MEQSNNSVNDAAMNIDELDELIRRFGRFADAWNDLRRIEEERRAERFELWKREVELYCEENGVRFSDIRAAIRKRFDWPKDIISEEPFTPSTRVVVMSCCHYYKEDSLKVWFLTKGKLECPVCRRCDEYIKDKDDVDTLDELPRTRAA